MSQTDFTGLRAAARHAGVAPETVRKWCIKYAIGQRDGHRWRIDRAELQRVMRAHAKAHEMLRGIG